MPYVPPTKALINGNIAAQGWAGTPADTIVRSPRPLWLPVFNNSLPALIRSLVENFYTYGRTSNNWKWGAFNNNGSPGAGTVGVPLVTGVIDKTNCGGFNYAMRQIASRILGVGNDLLSGQSCATAFMTKEGTVGIDSAWPGNVCTANRSFAQLGVYGFVNHSWCKDVAAGVYYDASTRVLDFHNDSDLMWATVVDFGNGGEWKQLGTVHNAVNVPGDPPYVKLRVGYLQQPQRLMKFEYGPVGTPLLTVNGVQTLSRGYIAALDDTSGPNGHWPTTIVVSYHHLPQAIRHESGVR